MERGKLSGKLILVTVFFVLADLFRLVALYSNLPFMQLRVASSGFNLLEMYAAFVMVGWFAECAKETKERWCYVPMLLYFLYGLSFIFELIELNSWMNAHYGYNGFIYYKWFLLAAELYLAIRMFPKKKWLAGVVAVCALAWAAAVYVSFGTAWLSAKQQIAASVVLGVCSVAAHCLTANEYGRSVLQAQQGRKLWKLWIGLTAVIVTALNIESYIQVRFAEREITFDAPVTTGNGEDSAEIKAQKEFLAAGDKTLAERIEDYLDSNGDKLSGAVLIENGENVIFQKAYGYADLEETIPNTANEVCGIALTTEQFTAGAILQLADAGVIRLEDRLSTYIPEYRYASQMTIQQLLDMTAGNINYDYQTQYYKGLLANMYGQNYENLESHLEFRDLFIRMLNGYELQFVPGTQYGFSRSDYYLLGLVIEQATGMTYEEYVQKNILEPAGMQHTYFDASHRTTESSYFGRNYTKQLSFSYTFAASGMYSTVEDLMLWQNALLSGKLISETSLQKMLALDTEEGNGYGWYEEDGGYRSYTADYGYTVCQYMNREADLKVVAIFNSSSGEAVNPMVNVEQYIVLYLQQKGE